MTGPTTGPAIDGKELHRLCVFALALTCGHRVTLAVSGWYPVSVACCDRLGGTILHGSYVPYASDVDYVSVVSEDYEYRPTGSPREPDQLLARQPRADEPHRGPDGRWVSAGRYPARVGAADSLDGTTAPATAH
ncbi:hypothetical protein Daura_06190 [Dactylosporangium aurantiacum]|uniref:Uncharacterized protein n=1 Tax=Dactylosporangium aurantiacum TaxID=35754 RepID=A0A9Q9IKL0_9ACTN|nr:hypothetical protein [Dactylosporangium aurantiacum]MDG6108803.1 hypothetical protein [Dactylosporangium aurantiacum]UWZ55790.1 hypothetical protein Daura_06190 [Dactylosporangium aurantiacum]